ncbi:hypothetical protein B1526_1722 [Bifidobacterium criceti]|uniref:Uncharacterized protein n=1 Tax=Bifidobacterium criceti TaxID=1960969 RepID=A0A2A2ECY9_9BIFI|nr:hypothetical protein B1526_1722 [Bifidobacterium criceti]
MIICWLREVNVRDIYLSGYKLGKKSVSKHLESKCFVIVLRYLFN